MPSPSKRSTHVEQGTGPVLTWSKPKTVFRWKPWQDIVALLGFAVAVAVFACLFFWGISEGAIW
jgi:hypothetical protein